MRFFTPDLYVRLQSTDDAVVDGVHAEWEARSAAYRECLGRFLPFAPRHVVELAGLYLHDVRVLDARLYYETEQQLRFGGPDDREQTKAALALMFDEGPRRVRYALDGPLTRTGPRADWPTPQAPPDWLYDEVDAVTPTTFVHRVLFATGHVWTIPFSGVEIEYHPER